LPVNDFGWGICVAPAADNPGSPVLLWVIPGNTFDGSEANMRALAIRDRLIAAGIRGQLGDVAALGQVYAAKVCGSSDWAVVLEGIIGDEWAKIELVTVDAATAKPYGAAPNQLAMFWAMRLKGLLGLGLGPNVVCKPNPCQVALMANWADWKSCAKWFGIYHPEF